jgi:hypothetical protein
MSSGQYDPAAIEHLVTWQAEGGRVVVMGLDSWCRPIYITEFFAYV